MTIAIVASSSEDSSARELELQRLAPVGFRLAYGMLGNAQEAEDAMQDAVFKAWRALGRVHIGSDLRPWFMTIVANECRQRRRSRWWSVARISDIRPGAAQTREPDPELIDLRKALEHLPADMRLVLVLRYYLDMTFVDMGQTLKCSPQAAKSRTHRALQRLRTEVPKELGS